MPFRCRHALPFGLISFILRSGDGKLRYPRDPRGGVRPWGRTGWGKWSTVGAGLSEDESHGPTTFPQHRVQTARSLGKFIAGETLYGLSKRHDIARQLIQVWVQKHEVGALDEDARAADLLQEYKARLRR